MPTDTENSYLIASDPDEIISFFRSRVWKDVYATMLEHLKRLQYVLEDPDLDHVKSNFIRGQIAQMRELIDLPETFLQSRLDQILDQNIESNNKENSNE